MAWNCTLLMKSFSDLFRAVFIDILRHTTRTAWHVNRKKFDTSRLNNGQTGVANNHVVVNCGLNGNVFLGHRLECVVYTNCGLKLYRAFRLGIVLF